MIWTLPKIPFPMIYNLLGNVSLSKIIGGGGAALPHPTTSFHSAKLCSHFTAIEELKFGCFTSLTASSINLSDNVHMLPIKSP